MWQTNRKILVPPLILEIGRTQTNTTPPSFSLHDTIEKCRTILEQHHTSQGLEHRGRTKTERSNAKDTKTKELDRSATHGSAFDHHETFTRPRYGMPVGSETNI